jgi:hypothetical protein
MNRRFLLWIAAFAFIGVSLVLLYHDAEQQDSGYHYLFARWAWQHPRYFVNVWARPLFTLLYSFPSQFGYPAAKLFTVAICLATAWQTFRLALQLKFERAELAVPFLFLQPSFLLLSSVVLTETLFALLFVIALRLHLSGRIKIAMSIASLLILIRPEGFFIAILWGFWILLDQRCSRPWWRRIPQTLLLSSGIILWWIAAYIMTGDPLWIANNWPPDWQVDGKANGTGPIWRYVLLLPLIVGPLLLLPFVYELARQIKRRELMIGTSSFLTLFILHSLMFWRGWFGSAGYPRYLVCVSPVIALITLAGWNRLAGKLRGIMANSTGPVSAGVFVVSFIICLFYIDGWQSTRDARAIEEMGTWFRANEKPISRLICSQAYMRIALDRVPWENPGFNGDRQHNLDLVRQSPKQTLIFWDEDTGPKWYLLKAVDFESAGYVRLSSQTFKLDGLFYTLPWNRFGGPRLQQMHLYYKD